MRMQFFDKTWDLSIWSWLEDVCTLGENVRTGSDHAYAQKAVEWTGKSPERNCKRDQLMLLTNLYKDNFLPGE